ncbi:amino acid ABC transporter permease [Pseudonocardia acidicola]|uniref:Amino acid ABC transporter permease n=1 Tax=Pseudonocardia acidicola TaxID=2724939 RepID=A0ABX1S6I4_9PSEU|nr:amino acid ABC transporter permease [Pseudonocardia acidicola]NMH95854.1 amino acid ABC transporter permease [Pseudonocardia acidicola]
MSAVLYDIPGPKARARNLTFGVVGTVALAGLLGYVLYRFIVTGQFDGRVWEWILYKNVQLLLVDGLLNTLRAFAVAAVLALLFGALFATGRLSDHTWISRPATVIVEFFRAIPLLILIFILYFGVSRGLGINISAFWALVLGLMLYNGSVLAEVFRAGVRSLPKGQSEAAYALGLRKTQVMTNVLLPQALRAMLPTIVSQLVVVLKDTALGFIILYPELLYQARYLGGQGQLGGPILQVALVVGVIYIAMCLLLSALANYLERRSRRNRRRIDADPRPEADADNQVLVSHAQGGGAAAR